MPLLGWLCVLAVTVAAVLFGQTARTTGHVPARRRTGIAVSIAGPPLVAAAGLLTAAVSGTWLAVATGTIAAVVLIAAVGVAFAPGAAAASSGNPTLPRR